MQIVSLGDKLHEVSNSIFWKRKRERNINLSSTKFAQRLPKVNQVSTSNFLHRKWMLAIWINTWSIYNNFVQTGYLNATIVLFVLRLAKKYCMTYLCELHNPRWTLEVIRAIHIRVLFITWHCECACLIWTFGCAGQENVVMSYINKDVTERHACSHRVNGYCRLYRRTEKTLFRLCWWRHCWHFFSFTVHHRDIRLCIFHLTLFVVFRELCLPLQTDRS